MGKAVSKVTRVLGFPSKPTAQPVDEIDPKPPQWDTTIDQLFGDAPPNDIGTGPLSEPYEPIQSPIKKRRRRAPPPPPSILDSPGRRRRQRRLPSSPARRRPNRSGNIHTMRTPLVQDLPRRVAKRTVRASNRSPANSRRSATVRRRIIENEVPARILVSQPFSRQPSIRRRRRQSSFHRNQRLQDLLQCPVCLNPYNEPRLLPCGHTFCDECLNRIISNEHDVVTCPVCRKEHLVPDDGVFTPNFIVRNLLEHAPFDQDHFSQMSKRSSGKVIQFYVAVRKITRSHSQVKRLTIEMPMGNYLRDTAERLIRRIAEREQFDTPYQQFVLEFGDKRLRPQRTLASYGVQNGDLLFLFNPEQRLSFLAYEDDQSLPPRENPRVRVPSSNSSASTNDIRTVTSNENQSQRFRQPLSTVSDQDDDVSSLYSEN